MATPPDLLSLAFRCEEADGADRKLDWDVLDIVCLRTLPADKGIFDLPPSLTVPDGRHSMDAAPFTSSLDTVVALVAERLPGWGHGYTAGPGQRIVSAAVIAPAVDPEASITDGRSWTLHHQSGARTPALALLAAFLRALASQENPDV